MQKERRKQCNRVYSGLLHQAPNAACTTAQAISQPQDNFVWEKGKHTRKKEKKISNGVYSGLLRSAPNETRISAQPKIHYAFK